MYREQPALRRRKFFQGRSIRGAGITDLTWFSPSGNDMTDQDWGGHVKCLGMRLAGDLIGELDERGEPIVGDTLLILMNAHHEPIPFTLPVTNPGHRWQCLFDTADDDVCEVHDPGEVYDLKDRSTVMFRTHLDDGLPAVTATQAEALRKEVRRAGPPLVQPTR